MPLPGLKLKLFGSFEAEFDGRPLSGFATDKVRALLAYMAIESGRPHRRETLSAMLWPDYPDETARSNLRKSLYRLRRALVDGDPALPDHLFSQDRQSVTLHPEAINLDVARFAGLVKEVKTAADPLALFQQIRQLYQGELLKGFSLPDAYAFEEWLTIQREVYHQDAVDNLTQLISLYEAQDDPDGLLAAAIQLLALDPWHERTHRQIMRAHRRKGNRPGAIAQYQELKKTLQHDLGVEPSEATISLYEQIRAEVSPVVDVTPTPTQGHIHRFPAPYSPLIGRKSELDYLVETLQNPDCRLLTLTGPGGIGKTRLCIETGRRLAASSGQFGDGLTWIPLAQLQAGEMLVPAIAQNLNLTFRSRSDPLQELLKYLENKRILLILDNFEQLLDEEDGETLPPAVSFLTELLSRSPDVTLFITSREPLSVQGEWVYTLEGLPYHSPNGDSQAIPLEQPAPQLFIQSARRIRPSFNPDSYTQEILEICQLTGGMPLALEIAAAWMRAYDPAEIARRIHDSLDFLTSPYRDAPARQRSIRAVFTSTWNQLSGDQQSALAGLSAFQGAFMVQAALFVTQATVLDLAVLVEKSLLRRAGEGRYLLHELVRAFAVEKLAESGQTFDIRARHAEYYFGYLVEQLPGLHGPNPQEATLLIQQALDNLRTAWQWAVANAQFGQLKPAMYGFAQFLILAGSGYEAEETFSRALVAVESSGLENQETLAIKSQLLSHLAWFESGLGKNQLALENAEKAVALADRCQDTLCRAHGLSILGWTLQVLGNYDESVAALTEAVIIFNQHNEPLRASLALIRLGSVYWRKRDFEKTLAYYRRSLEIEERLQNKRGINRASGGIGLVYGYLDQYDEALEWLDKALALDRELGNQFGVTRHLGNMGTFHLILGDYQQALTCYQEAARIDLEIGHKSTLAIWLGSIGNAYRLLAEYDLALDYYDRAIAMHQELADRFNLCETLLGKGEVLMILGDMAGARPLIAQGKQMADEIERNEIQFRARLLEARLLAKSDMGNEAGEKLKTMLSDLADSENGEGFAQINYELWQIKQEPQYARLALDAYQAALSRVGKAEYRTRSEELSRFLTGAM